MAGQAAEPLRVRITITGTHRDYLLTSGETASIANWPRSDAAPPDDAVPQVSMPAEALLRLVYGRLDADHTPTSVSGDPEVLAKLRTMFPVPTSAGAARGRPAVPVVPRRPA